jgi:phosphoribosylformylglycinamidine (FGAM) synthase-like amidotransferase family enzyme
MKRKEKFEEMNFNIDVNGTPVEVVAKPYINGSEEKRFRVSVNGSPIHIFGLNKQEQKVVMMDSPSEPIPVQIQTAIGEKLLSRLAA